MKKVAGYVRVSTEKQKKEDSHIRQKERLEEWAERNDVDIEFFQDIAISGQKKERKAYDEMMSRLDEFDGIAVRELSRFGRSLKKVIDDVSDLEDKDVEFISLKENLDTQSAQGKLFFHIMGAFNQYWADISRERTQEMIERKKEKGEKWGRKKKIRGEKLERAEELQEAGLSYSAIGSVLVSVL